MLIPNTMFAYKILMMIMLFENIIKLIPRLFLLAIYLFSSGLILIFFNESEYVKILTEFRDPIYPFKYLYFYLKWWFYNKNVIEIKYSAYIIAAITAPYLAFHTLKWLSLQLSMYIRVAIFKCVSFIWNRLIKKTKNKNTTSTSTNSMSKTKTEEIKKEIMEEISKALDKLMKKHDK